MTAQLVASSESPILDVRPADVVVPAGRDREAGDVSDLAASIAEIGLLHPPVVTSDLVLVAGLRRLTAVKQLGWATVPVFVPGNLDDAAAALRAELDENTVRRDLSPVEVARARARRAEALRPLADANRKATQAKPGQQVGVSKLDTPSDSVGAVRKTAAQGLGLSASTLDKVDAVVAAAADPVAPAPVRQAAVQALTELAKPGANVSKAVRQVDRAKRDAALAAAQERSR